MTMSDTCTEDSAQRLVDELVNAGHDLVLADLLDCLAG
jgi:hypothetical protein